MVKSFRVPQTMMSPHAIAGLPIWLSALLILGLAVSGAGAIELAARRLLPIGLRQDHNDVSAAIFAVIGTTYAVMLAFVAMLALEGFNKAQAITDTEASLVENIYRLVDGLSGPDMQSMRLDIVGYADFVVAHEWPDQAAGRAVVEDEPHLTRLTKTALHLRPGSVADGDVHTLLLGDLGQLSAARRERLFDARTPIPAILWAVLMAGGALTVAFSSFLGAPSLRMHLAMSSLLAASGALVLLAIVALSNPFRGDFRVSPEPFEQVLTQMKTS
jgi:hypothetical protein